MTNKKLEDKIMKCPFAETCVSDREKDQLACLGEANHLQCVIYRERIKYDEKYLKKK